MLLGNYTGDRLNFGKAFEKAKIAGIKVFILHKYYLKFYDSSLTKAYFNIKVEGFIVGEDVASSHNKTGGRGMCGEVFIFKVTS